MTDRLRRRRDSGAMLLAVLFMMAMMILTALAVFPALIQEAKRDREEEMIHRGTEYARAIRRYYKKFGRYPGNLEALDNTNQLHFIRKRYKDPLTKDGEWKLLRYGDIAALLGPNLGINTQNLAGQQAGAFGTQAPGVAGPGTAAQGAGAGAQAGQFSIEQGAGMATQVPFGGQAGGTSPPGTGGMGQSSFSLGPSQGQNTDAGGTQAGTAPGAAPGTGGSTGQTGTNTLFGNTGTGQTFGGGAIVGVASKSKDPTIRIFNKKKNYDEWQFIYAPTLEIQNVLLRGPFNGLPMTAQIGTPPGQLNQANPGTTGQQPGAFGQQPAFGQQNQQPNQQPNQQLAPGGQFPPDQSQPPN